MPLQLEKIRGQLIRLEETIILALIERAQYKQNLSTYEEGKSKRPLLKRLYTSESSDKTYNRFHAPEERPFFREFQDTDFERKGEAKELKIDDFNQVNLTRQAMDNYLNLIRKMCISGDDGEHGSSTEEDIVALRRIWKRIHYGAFYVAEYKYQSAPEEFSRLIMSEDMISIERKITDETIEKKIIDRVRTKARSIQGFYEEQRHRIDPEILADFYKDTIIPLTKAGEIAYLMNRKDIMLTFNIGELYHIEGVKSNGKAGWASENKDEPCVFEGIYDGAVGPISRFKIEKNGSSKDFQIPTTNIRKARILELEYSKA